MDLFHRLTMVAEFPLNILPLFSGAVWMAVAAWPLTRRGYRAWDMAFFAFALLLGAWCWIDWVFFTTSDLNLSYEIAKFRMTVMTEVALFLLLSSRWAVLAKSKWDTLFAVVSALMIFLGWTVIPRGIEQVSWGPRIIRDPFFYTIWVIHIAAYVLLGTWYLAKAYLHVRPKDPELAAKFAIMMTIFVGILILGVTTNISNNIFGLYNQPWLSSLLVVPGGILSWFLYTRGTQAIRRFVIDLMPASARPLGAIVIYHNDRVIGQRAIVGMDPLDSQALALGLRAIDGFLKRSFNTPERSLKTIKIGDVSIVTESGRSIKLCLLFKGNPPESVRSEMRAAVARFERDCIRPLGDVGDTGPENASVSKLLSKFIRDSPEKVGASQ